MGWTKVDWQGALERPLCTGWKRKGSFEVGRKGDPRGYFNLRTHRVMRGFIYFRGKRRNGVVDVCGMERNTRL